jgi:hypothetical protein
LGALAASTSRLGSSPLAATVVCIVGRMASIGTTVPGK